MKPVYRVFLTVTLLLIFTGCGQATSPSSNISPTKAISSPTATLAPSTTPQATEEPAPGDCSSNAGGAISIGKNSSTIQISCPKGKYTMHVSALSGGDGENPPDVIVDNCTQFDTLSIPGQFVSNTGEVKSVTTIQVRYFNCMSSNRSLMILWKTFCSNQLSVKENPFGTKDTSVSLSTTC